MKTIKAITIDDEQQARKLLQQVVKMCNLNIEIIGEADDLESGVLLIKQKNPDIVFLDINMPQQSGLEIGKYLDGLPDFKIIFVTAYDEYAIDAIRLSAFDYLMKPIDVKELTNCLKRYLEDADNLTAKEDFVEQVNHLEENMNQPNKSILIASHQSNEILPIEDIIYLQASGMYTHFYTKNREVVSSKPLKIYEDMLPDTFFRCHRSYLINTSHVIKLNKKEGLKIELQNGVQVPLAKTRKEPFMEIFKID